MNKLCINSKGKFRISKGSLLTIGVVTAVLLTLGISLQDTSNLGLTQVKTVQASTNQPWIIPIGSEFNNSNWSYGFKICPDRTIDEGIILVTSDISDSAIDITSPIEQGKCKTFSVSIPANDPESIFVSIIEAI